MPALLKGVFDLLEGPPTASLSDPEAIQRLFPLTFGQPSVQIVPHRGAAPLSPLAGRRLRVGIVFSGGPAPGGHNVLTGLLDFLLRRNQESSVVGFLGGPGGLVDGRYKELAESDLTTFRNLGGFHFLGTGRTKIETPEQLKKSAETCAKLGLNGLIIVGGDDSNTNAGVLAEYFKEQRVDCCVIGVPKTIDGDLRSIDIEASFGFDTASKIYSYLISNLCFDAASALKTYHFIRVMGRDASHITLECALQTHPNLVFISEEVGQTEKPLVQCVEDIVNLVVCRSEKGLSHGVILIPEGLIGFASDMKSLLSELNELLAKTQDSVDPKEFDSSRLTPSSRKLYSELPEYFLRQMLAERDPHGNVQVSMIETERLMAHMVRVRLEQLKSEGRYKGKFNYVAHFFGYEGRCGFPSKFDCDYCYTLGATAGALVEAGRTGLIATVKNLASSAHKWTIGGTSLCR
jgi:pyrophosphate--fructose-6-phosphate 1-phosphotransferase